ncbi:MAG: PEP-CTERM sorting domain-containing protein, partial [Thermoguttaceae bacterium]|nr:PEP-CTERM sorting domain-containing protein [Thermoguttaceae bacterium]
DYIFANAGNVGGEFDWIIDGLVPNDLYELTLLTGSVGSRSAYFSVNGEERLVDPNSSDTWLVQTTELGEILGIFASSNTGGEQNWSGLLLTYVGASVSDGVPEPSTAVLMLLSMAGGVFWLRRKTRTVRD